MGRMTSLRAVLSRLDAPGGAVATRRALSSSRLGGAALTARKSCVTCRAADRGVYERLATRRLVHTSAAVSSTQRQSADAKPEVEVVLKTSDESETLLKLRHTSSHVLAQAVQKLFPGAQVTIGPWTEMGFYYDFDLEEPFTDSDLKKIRKEMIRIIKKKLPMWEETVSVEEARKRIDSNQEPYKLEILDSILARDPEAVITIWHTGEVGSDDHWWDLCGGPHMESTGHINPKGLALENVSGAYWRGDEKNKMLQRVYGTTWETSAELQAYKKMKQEALKRDHRKLGAQLNLFSIQQEDAGGGLVFWHPKGATVRNQIEEHWRNIHIANGYDLVYTPHIAKIDLWKTSGHFDFYGESMFKGMEVDEDEYQLRPMNCPFHVELYKNSPHSYREFPLRWAELGTVYRYEKSGALHGLFRVRGFTQDDAHIFCLPSQVTDEIQNVLNLVEDVLSAYEFTEYEINLSTRPEKYVGSDDVWELSENALKEALGRKGWDYTEDVGGGAFYGPKIDIKIKDAIGRKWQCSTIQVDFNLPERFDMEYVDENNERPRPIMIHRAIFGSIERFFGVLLESYAGLFPLWLAPVQARIVCVTDGVNEYAAECLELFKSYGLRVDMAGGESLGKLVRNAEVQKIPLVFVIGNSEVEAKTLSVRSRHQGDLGSMKPEDVIKEMKQAVVERSRY
ncbi:threonyl-tRNA synthetase [Chloropicon primus]|uniref:threonine--tRNA ligase n=2 Tax=Chloropicon primus TaxID=1764295 RepID=A0A5B8MBA5_9CHLO|nr:threonyl-tRNA synthetase [Chloropicon primus]UPQ96882.1 threonyl-tRNA synthetase [Chloropicon primus]|eukprot:QDZ17666.1 threonyl-tRNA synthetase [Chloropicon primus]